MTKVYSEITPPTQKMENFRFEMTKVYSAVPPPPTPPPPKMKNFRFEMTKVYSARLPPLPPPPDGLQSGRSYVETNLYRPWIPLVLSCMHTSMEDIATNQHLSLSKTLHPLPGNHSKQFLVAIIFQSFEVINIIQCFCRLNVS